MRPQQLQRHAGLVTRAEKMTSSLSSSLSKDAVDMKRRQFRSLAPA